MNSFCFPLNFPWITKQVKKFIFLSLAFSFLPFFLPIFFLSHFPGTKHSLTVSLLVREMFLLKVGSLRFQEGWLRSKRQVCVCVHAEEDSVHKREFTADMTYLMHWWRHQSAIIWLNIVFYSSFQMTVSFIHWIWANARHKFQSPLPFGLFQPLNHHDLMILISAHWQSLQLFPI